jgi:hypothetical protein
MDEVELSEQFDVVCYWDGFGVGTGQEMHRDTYVRRYDFGAQNCRMLDRWWPPHKEHEAVTQSLRCYSPAQIGCCVKGLCQPPADRRLGMMLDEAALKCYTA